MVASEADFGFVGPVEYSQFTCPKAVFAFVSKLGDTWLKKSSPSRALQRMGLVFKSSVMSQFETLLIIVSVIGMVASMQMYEVL